MQQDLEEKEISIEPVEEEDEPEQPVPGVEHYSEPDAENIMPAEDRPGTF